MTGLLAAPLAVVTAAAPAHADVVDVQILATNDFHGRLLPNRGEAGAAQFAGAVAQLESTNANTIFAAGGDLIGASTFDSFIARDKPTLDALNAAGLDVSAAGNHELDNGYRDLVDRVMAPETTDNPQGGAAWQYIAANLRKRSDGSYALPDVTDNTPDPLDESNGATWMTTVGGVKVGFVGAVTEELPTLVIPGGIADIRATEVVAEVNAGADALKSAGADMVVLLVHEGAKTTNISSLNDGSAFARIVNGVDSDVSAIVSGHTHLAYNHLYQGRPVVSAGQYGTNLNQLVFTVDTATDAVTLKANNIVAAGTLALTDTDAIAKKAEVQEIVDAAVAEADVLGKRVLGKIGGPSYLARTASGDVNRGGESTVANLVAEIQRWATASPEAGSAQIAFINAGGVREDMLGLAANGYPADLTYRQAAAVQSFANTLVNMKMTGAQIKTMLEQQWQRDDKGQVPSRPFQKMGASKGFFSTYDPSRPEGDRVTGMWLNGNEIAAGTTYSVTVNAFLAGGGDNFRVFNEIADKRDTGKVDLQAMVDYMAANAATTPLPVDYQQRYVGVDWPADKPRFYRIGQDVELALSSLAMTGSGDLRDQVLNIKVGDRVLNPESVDNTLTAEPFDEAGRSAVDVKLKGKTRTGTQMLTFTGATTGSTFSLPIEVRKAKGVLKARSKPGRIVRGETRTRVKIKATALGIAKVTGKVKVKAGGKTYTVKLKKGRAFLRLDRFAKTGTKRILVSFQGNRKIRGTQQVIKIKVRRN